MYRLLLLQRQPAGLDVPDMPAKVLPKTSKVETAFFGAWPRFRTFIGDLNGDRDAFTRSNKPAALKIYLGTLSLREGCIAPGLWRMRYMLVDRRRHALRPFTLQEPGMRGRELFNRCSFGKHDVLMSLGIHDVDAFHADRFPALDDIATVRTPGEATP